MRRMVNLLLAVGTSAACAAAQEPVVESGQLGPGEVTEASTIWDGVYTEAQARRGERLAESHCALCHIVEVEWPLVLEERAGESIFDIFELVRLTMPENFPGGLRRTEYADILAYMLRLRGAPPGQAELAAGPSVLQAIVITPEPSRRSSAPESGP